MAWAPGGAGGKNGSRFACGGGPLGQTPSQRCVPCPRRVTIRVACVRTAPRGRGGRCGAPRGGPGGRAARHACRGGALGQLGSRRGVPSPGRILLVLRVARAREPHVFLVVTVVLAPRPRGAVAQRGLAPQAAHVVQPDGPRPGAVVRFAHAGPDLSTAQLPAGHSGVAQVPVVVTHRPPAPRVPHLQPPGAPVGPVGQTNPEGPWCPGGAGRRRGRSCGFG